MNKKYDVIKGLADPSGSSKERTALILGFTVRHINHMLAGYKTFGEKYYDTNFTLFTELLDKHKDISISASSVSEFLEAKYFFSPKITRTKQKQLKNT